MDESSEKPKRIGRRGFLKGLGAVGGAAALRKPIKYLEGKKPTETKKESERLKIETKNATYYPFYERHDLAMQVEDLASVKNIDLHFVEGPFPSHWAINTKAKDIIHFNGTPEWDSTITTRLFEEDNLKYFSENNVYLSMETGNVPGSLSSRKMSMIAQHIPGLGLLFAGMADYLRTRSRDKPVNLLDFIRTSGLISGGIWATSRLTTESILDISERYYPNTEDKQSLKRIIRRINGLQSLTHPEDTLVFYRNVMMARRLTLLGQKLPETKQIEKKPSISYQVGAAHSGIEDFIRLENLGDGFSLAMLEIYPKEFLEDIVRINGNPVDSLENQIQTFSSTVIIPVKENLEGDEDIKHVVVDEKLRDYLKARLLQPEKEEKPPIQSV